MLVGEGIAPEESTTSKRLPADAPPTTPTTSPTGTPPTVTSNDPNDDKQNDGTDSGVDDQRDGSETEMNAQARQQPITNKRADNSYYQITDEAKTTTVYDFTSQPAGNNSNQYYDQ
jgi:hypothetical protein